MQAAARKLLVSAAVSLLLLSACGGSSDDGAGQLSEYQVQPDKMSLASGTANCPGAGGTPVKAGEFLVIGGVPPYSVTTSFPDAVLFGAHLATAPTHQGGYTVSNRNEQFSVFVQGCLNPGNITVLDQLGRRVNATVTAASGNGT
jgi:hypothetical protein